MPALGVEADEADREAQRARNAAEAARVNGGDYGGSDSSSTDSSGGSDIQTFDASGLPFKFNPPLHPSARHVLTDLDADTRSEVRADLRTIYDETGNRYGKNAAKNKFPNLRLGRIVQGDEALTFAMIEKNERYGMRFLYNPETIQGGSQVNGKFIPDKRSTGNYVLQQGLEQISFEILINRIPDVQSGARKADYLPASISQKDRDLLLERGTHHDLEFLYRCANGLHSTRVRSNTGDIGLLLPNPCELFIGPFRYRGALVSVNATDEMFSSDLVPILTRVQVVFSRFFSVVGNDYSRAESLGLSADSTSISGGSDPGSSAPGSEVPNSGTPMSGREVYNLARSVGFSGRDADIATQISYQESTWNPRALNARPPDLSYGLWQINMYSDGARRRSLWGLRSNADLYDPKVNARCAYELYKGRGGATGGPGRFNDWSVYLNGSYARVKKTW